MTIGTLQHPLATENNLDSLTKHADMLLEKAEGFYAEGNIEEARRHAKTPPKYTDQLLETLQEMNNLARAIQGRRRGRHRGRHRGRPTVRSRGAGESLASRPYCSRSRTARWGATTTAGSGRA